MAAIPAVLPAVEMCPVVQKEIAKISAVPISRHVMAFAIVLRIEDALLDFPIGPSPVDFSRSGMIAPDPRGHWSLSLNFGEVRGAAPGWPDLSSSGSAHRSTGHHPNR